MYRFATVYLCFAAALGGILLVSLSYGSETIIEQTNIFSSDEQTHFAVRPWNMAMNRAKGGTDEQSQCLWFNHDWKAKPWAGISFKSNGAAPLRLTQEWIDKGFIRLTINVTVDRYGNIGGGDQFQLLPITQPQVARYQSLRSQFIDRGRGIDEESSTWQEVFVPLKYFSELRPGLELIGLHFQTCHQIQRTFSLDEVAYVRFDTLPAWMIEQLNEKVIQADVTWPAYDELPEVVKADQRPLSVRNGVFVYPDGSRAFLLNPYCREDSRTVYGCSEPGKLPSTYGLYDREKHGWIYDEVPTTKNLCRLGFNSYSVTPVPTAWWRSVGYQKPNRGESDQFLSSVLSKRVTMPYHVDLVSWPWTMGRPGLNVDETDLPASAATVGRNHWVQYRIIGAGKKAWLDMWRLCAARYRDAGANVASVELMNEPAYMGESEDHHAEFARWLIDRYGSIAEVNSTWGTGYSTIAEASAYRFSYSNPSPAGQKLDYDRYLSERFEELITEGADAVREILPETLVGIQTMGGYVSSPREAVWKHHLAKRETVVITPTGGGRWTRGSRASRPSETLTTHPMADAPIENDLLLSIADEKMIVDNETYLRGQTREETRNRLWEHVVCGLDGLTIFSWSKRGWVWWKDRQAVQVDADKFPFSSLIPIARRTDALRGILDFSEEVQTLAPKILPKPWGPEPRIGMLYSWDNARRRTVQPELTDKGTAYFAAMRYSHWNMTMLPSDRVIEDGIPESIEVIVAAGITHVERELPAILQDFVERGGVLVLGECDFTQDIYGRPLADGASFLEGELTERDATAQQIQFDQSLDSRFPGKAIPLKLQQIAAPKEATVVLQDLAWHPVVTCIPHGKGAVYQQAADIQGYALAKVIHHIFRHAGRGEVKSDWRSVEVSNEDGSHAPNILVSRRSYADHHAILILNRDRYKRTVRVAIPGLSGSWRVSDSLTEDAPSILEGHAISAAGILVNLASEGPAVLLLEKNAE